MHQTQILKDIEMTLPISVTQTEISAIINTKMFVPVQQILWSDTQLFAFNILEMSIKSSVSKFYKEGEFGKIFIIK